MFDLVTKGLNQIGARGIQRIAFEATYPERILPAAFESYGHLGYENTMFCVFKSGYFYSEITPLRPAQWEMCFSMHRQELHETGRLRVLCGCEV